jgi:hypothetical protein
MFGSCIEYAPQRCGSAPATVGKRTGRPAGGIPRSRSTRVVRTQSWRLSVREHERVNQELIAFLALLNRPLACAQRRRRGERVGARKVR